VISIILPSLICKAWKGVLTPTLSRRQEDSLAGTRIILQRETHLQSFSRHGAHMLPQVVVLERDTSSKSQGLTHLTNWKRTSANILK
jgi:hypothetical protein